MTTSRRTVLIAFSAGLSAGLLAACESTTGTPVPAPVSTSSKGATDLAGVLVRPTGYQAMPNDTLSGPLRSASDVRTFFQDHPTDGDTILNSGYVAGYTRFWRQNPAGPVTGRDFPLRSNAHGIVLQFNSTANAKKVLSYFRQRNTEDHYAFFQVPSSLANGFGGYLVQPGDTQNPTTYAYGVAWTQETRVFNVGVTYFTKPDSPREVIDHALAQAEAR